MHQIHEDNLVNEIAGVLAAAKIAGTPEAGSLCGGNFEETPGGMSLEQLTESYKPAARLLVEQARGK